MKESLNIIKAPRQSEKAALRIMIVLGVAAMAYMMKWLLQPIHIGHAPLYWLVIATMVYMLLRILHEWYHYFFITIPETPVLTRQYKVDVLTTFCDGEPYEMLRETLEAIQRISYPHESYLCDDAQDPWVEKLCKDLDVHYVTRENRKDAKAGNINNALKQAKGEICVILDPDHVPQADFLNRVLPHFEDPAIGFVQVVQAYKNKHENLIAKGAAQQTFQFYGPMMMTMNKYGTVQAIGANCTFRREALDSIGGHAAGLAEDMHTAMQLHFKGWKSLYEPVVVARGLVPSTLSGYYKQQLKWARGTTDLLMNTYPRLYKGFSARQRLHYATIPFHYFSGFIFLLNFLIPVLALVFNLIPMKVDLKQLFLVATPFMATVLLIRHFVQRWVMEESERGFHIIGGILHIGTWWINILGVLFTLFRVEVPYDPTPKDGVEGNTFKLNIPNIIVGVISLSAVVYGLALDWSPFSLFMASLALINTSFMIFMVVAGFQPKIREFNSRRTLFDGALRGVERVRREAWLFRHTIYTGVRKAGLPLSVLITLVSMFLFKFSPGPQSIEHFLQYPFYTGIYAPAEDQKSFTDLAQIEALEQQGELNVSLIPIYLPWTGDTTKQFPAQYLQEVYNSEAFPLITWEPWISTFSHPKSDTAGTFRQIADGKWDDFVQRMAVQFKSLNKPVFLRFAHEPDNPQYPWSENGLLKASDYKSAWVHVRQVFDQAGADNVIWVWNPWHAESAREFFPGEQQVDWIGLTLLNYAEMNKGGKWKSFEQLYLSYDSTGLFDYELPVMLTEFGSLKRNDRQLKWHRDAFKSIEDHHPEIRALVLFHDSLDANVPDHSDLVYSSLDWSMQRPDKILAELSEQLAIGAEVVVKSMPQIPVHSVSDSIIPALNITETRGINFHKGKDWQGNYDELSMRTATKDFANIKAIGTEVVKWYGPGIYDRNALRVASNQGLQIMYSIWIPDHIDYIKDQDQLAEVEARILKAVKQHRDKPQIVAWNLGNNTWQGLARSCQKPELFYQQSAYLAWVNHILNRIVQLDPHRPVTMDMALNPLIADQMDYLSGKLPGISSFGIRVELKDTLSMYLLNHSLKPYFISAVPACLADNFKGTLTFVEHYKDQRTANYASLSGLLDINGWFKPDYFLLKDQWTNKPVSVEPLDLRIVSPARPVFAHQKLRYHALIKDEKDQWVMVDYTNHKDLKFSWYLVQTDRYGNYLQIKREYHGPSAKVIIPDDYENYRLYLTVNQGVRSWNVLSKLNRSYHFSPSSGG